MTGTQKGTAGGGAGVQRGESSHQADGAQDLPGGQREGHGPEGLGASPGSGTRS